ncbi:hypothetical protein CDAR_613661 [Caerostris darwini]|uniref:Uncharacterized protein n=1 Tax=Caerostris darwini TaxID=1538125 RepID=A0AAV4RYG4_9ARAC|nr:hypothetical protein CDAR_613661 [Caerostris darwini]
MNHGSVGGDISPRNVPYHHDSNARVEAVNGREQLKIQLRNVLIPQYEISSGHAELLLECMDADNIMRIGVGIDKSYEVRLSLDCNKPYTVFWYPCHA